MFTEGVRLSVHKSNAALEVRASHFDIYILISRSTIAGPGLREFGDNDLRFQSIEPDCAWLNAEGWLRPNTQAASRVQLFGEGNQFVAAGSFTIGRHVRNQIMHSLLCDSF